MALIDYGMGNLGSVEKALQYVGCAPMITSSPQQLEEASGIVLPGVGAFDDCVRGLRDRGLAARADFFNGLLDSYSPRYSIVDGSHIPGVD